MKISKRDYNKLQNAIENAKAETYLYNIKMNNILNYALEVTKEKDDGGFTFDVVYNDNGTLDDLLRNLNIEVEKE